MARRDYSASESESQPKQAQSNSRSSTKARNLALQQAQKEILSKHINSNGPQDKPLVDPLDFESLPNESLRKYRELFLLPNPEEYPNVPREDIIPTSFSRHGELLRSKLAQSTLSAKRGNRISKNDLANVVKSHYLNTPVKESDIITNFIYKVINQGEYYTFQFTLQHLQLLTLLEKKFKLDFNQ
ncbi:unnamed protein product [Kuraishia capsulata CBS 1993]|uniref:Histone deacetylase complex subunit SAP30 Sin3 binding domain-containing protein n=1 Tax=Kuraishia capsulata CBS 1993 TaxID=1382522 RepID=W6ML00_9ASCO|nr:uncharacterized protein KUCA_T00003078001 [Kuraishia capsulata CBS 1993]CDK27101.1 unnamed protein product [Kuraishia capsulata CBS 1993]